MRRRLRRGAVDRPHHDVLAPRHIDAEFDHPVHVDARQVACAATLMRGGRGRARSGTMGCPRSRPKPVHWRGIILLHGDGQFALPRSLEHHM
jgi:hypothetical protein